jgi:RNA polymerase sigma-70 factor (ECF subfamily)
LQETFLVVQRKADTFAANSNFIAWAFQIARFQVMKAQAQRRSAAHRFSDEVIEALAASAPALPFDEAKLAALPGCLEQLAPQARRIVELCYQHEHKPREIARLLGWTAAAVSVTLTRARAALRDCVERRLAKETP